MHKLNIEIKPVLLAVALLAILSSAKAERESGCVASGRYRPEWATQGIPLPPLHEKYSQHFLLTNLYEQKPPSDEGWMAKIIQRGGDLDAAGLQEDGKRWRMLFLDAASWHYPRTGDLDVAAKYFQLRSNWALRALQNPQWVHDTDILNAATEILSEISEWSFPIGELWFEDKPGQKILQKAGVKSPTDLLDASDKVAYWKALEEDSRRHELARLQEVLFAERRKLSRTIWWHCKQAMISAEKENNKETLQRLESIKLRVFDNVDLEDRTRLYYDESANISDCPANEAQR